MSDQSVVCRHCETRFERRHYCNSVDRIIYSTDPGDVLVSAAIAAMTDSVLLGAALGGSLLGGLLGDSLDGDL